MEYTYKRNRYDCGRIYTIYDNKEYHDITVIHEENIPLYEKAVEQFNKKFGEGSLLIINESPYTIDDGVSYKFNKNCSSLWCLTSIKDLSKFWAYIDKGIPI